MPTTYKPILYVDLDGTVADFELGIDNAIRQMSPFKLQDISKSTQAYDDVVDLIFDIRPNIFRDLPEIDYAVSCLKELSEQFDIYFASAPVWGFPQSYTDKRIWVEKAFGSEFANKRLILTHRKDLLIGDYLVDDRPQKHGAENFTGKVIHFRSEKYPDWLAVKRYLESDFFCKHF